MVYVVNQLWPFEGFVVVSCELWSQSRHTTVVSLTSGNGMHECFHPECMTPVVWGDLLRKSHVSIVVYVQPSLAHG